MSMSASWRVTGALAACAIAALAWAARDIDAGKSRVIATFRQDGMTVDAPFTRFSGHIDVDAAKPGSGHATIEVDMGSLDLGDEAYNAEVRRSSWLDSEHFPTATFTSSAIVKRADGLLEVTGKLTIKGRTAAVVVPVTIWREAGVTRYDGAMSISRRTFGIGEPKWDEVLDDAVQVHFQLAAAG